MLLGLAGVSGVGKSHYTNLIAERFGFSRVHILTTRTPRLGDAKGDKIYVTSEELENLRKLGKVALELTLLGNRYAYLKEELEDQNAVFEIHYTNITDFRRAYPKFRSIYLFPTSLDAAKQRIHERNLAPEVELARFTEAEQHLRTIRANSELRQLFNYELYNHYDQTSETELLNLINNLLQTEKTEQAEHPNQAVTPKVATTH